ncbi:uncharacterized protein LOC120294794 isoform X3 [Eucalyptus grandis]|uniref:uncharacterized protein LOC120294794 isoform X3 n=1 Tax=Eucalyptus grandis TaxID=71139 RepID=UPI00192EF37D|nr:uncharacterized protein LOC120294794 isoform X3 [Eucalyptus grandis]
MSSTYCPLKSFTLRDKVHVTYGCFYKCLWWKHGTCSASAVYAQCRASFGPFLTSYMFLTSTRRQITSKHCKTKMDLSLGIYGAKLMLISLRRFSKCGEGYRLYSESQNFGWRVWLNSWCRVS